MQKIRFGIVGCGAIGPTHAKALREINGAGLVAVADVLRDRADRMAADYGVSRVYQTDDEMIADPEVDAIIFATPSGSHGRQAEAALRAGKHVVVEKPMEITLAACDRMIAAAEQSNKKLAVISQHRFDPASQLVKDAIDGGRLGRMILIEMSVKWWRTQQYYDSGDWRGTWEHDGGGALMNQGIHTVDLMRWIGGPVTAISARVATAGHERIEVEDVAVASLQFANGAIGTLTASTACYDGQPARVEFYGTEGSAVIEGDRLKVFRLKDGTDLAAESANAHAVKVASGGTASVRPGVQADDHVTGTQESAAEQEGSEVVSSVVVPADAPETLAPVTAATQWGDAHREQLIDFIDAIHHDRQPLINGPQGRQAVEIILGVYQSSRDGRPITLA